MSRTRALDGKAVVVTGAGGGLGAAYARAIAGRGARVIVNDIDRAAAARVAKDINGNGGIATAHVADVSSWSEAGGLIARSVREFGTIDGLVNNAGYYAAGRLEEIDEHAVRRLIDVNLIGTINCAAHAARLMIERGQGSIVNVASGGQMGVPTMSVYGATKGGVATLTYAWAMELKGRGIRVNAISPLADSRMSQERDLYRADRGMPPLGPPNIPPENNAPVVEFLLADASAGVTGQVVRIEGKSLGLCSHPGILLPLIEHEQWTLESVTEAFRQNLLHRQVPLGIVGIEQTVQPNPSGFWKMAGDSS